MSRAISLLVSAKVAAYEGGCSTHKACWQVFLDCQIWPGTTVFRQHTRDAHVCDSLVVVSFEVTQDALAALAGCVVWLC